MIGEGHLNCLEKGIGTWTPGCEHGTVTTHAVASLDAKLALLDGELRRLGRVVVAFSGGADSAFLAHRAHQVLGTDAAHAVTAVSPSLAGDEEVGLPVPRNAPAPATMSV